MRRYYLILLFAASSVRAADLLSTQSGTSISTNTWTQVTPTGETFDIPGWEFLHYVPSIGNHCVLANYREVSGEPNRAWVCYDAKANHVTIHDIGGHWHSEHWPDGGHPTMGYQVDPSTSLAMGLCCNSGSQVSEGQRRWTWVYDFFGQVGRVKKADNTLYGAMQMGGAFDAINNKLVVHGGDSGFIGTSEYDPVNNHWNVSVACTAVATNCPTPGAINPSMAWRSVNGRIYLFGGIGGGQPDNNNVYIYDTATHTWTKQATPGTKPAARELAGWVYQPHEDKFFLYGGNDSSQNGLNDTWLYDPVADEWTQLSPTASPSVGASRPWDRVSYDPELDLVINLRGTRTGYQFWVFRYRAGSKLGYAGASSASPSAGALNRNSSESWASYPTVAASGAGHYRAWVETSATLANNYEHPSAQSVTGGTATNLGNSVTSVASNTLNNNGIRLAVINSRPWVCWEEVTSGGPTTVWAKGWDGSAWALGGQVDSGISGACSIVAVGTVPHVAYLKRNGSEIELHVRKLEGGVWSAVGASRLNVNASNSWAGQPSIVSDGANPCVAWSEYASDLTTSKVYVYCWTGSSWTAKGANANVTATNVALFPSLTYVGSTPYVAFVEFTINSADQHAKLYVRSFNGTSWVTVGAGALNRDPNTGWAFRPHLTNDGTNLYVAWAEQGNTQSQASLARLSSYGQRPQIHTAKWNGTAWSYLGGSANKDTAYGAAVQPAMAVVSGNPVLIWVEVKHNTLRKVYTAQWDGSDWGAVPSAAPGGGITIPGSATIMGATIP